MTEEKYEKVTALREKIQMLKQEKASLESKLRPSGKIPKAGFGTDHSLTIQYQGEGVTQAGSVIKHVVPHELAAKFTNDLLNYYNGELDSSLADYERL